jgi:cyclohexa-1,5-dienecarbonyl-CoA hydratase
MEFKLIKFEKKDKVSRIRLSTPPLNVMNIAMMKEINEALADIKKDTSLKALIFDHEGEKAFSAGVDVADHTEEKVDEMLEVFHRIFRNLSEIDIPTFAIVDGVALGGGCELVSFCDVVVASERSRIGQPEITVGTYPPVAVPLFPYLFGLRRTYELLLSGKVIDAKEAERIGLVTVVLPVEDFRENAERYIREQYLGKSKAVLCWTKRAIKACLGVPFLEGLRTSEIIYRYGLMSTYDAKEGLRAFLEKRKPEWKDE